MKKQLLMAAMAAMTLGASAQVTEVARGSFYFLPKSMTTTGEVVPFTANNILNYLQYLHATVYDQSFNVVKTIDYSGKTFEYISTPMKATVDISETERTITSVSGGFKYESVEIESFDAFKEYARSKYGDIPDVAFSITPEGYWAFSELKDGGGTIDYEEGENNIYFSPSDITVTYYNSDEKTIHSGHYGNTVKIKVNLDNVAWEVDADNEPTVGKCVEHLRNASVKNYDLGGITNGVAITQNLFNDDEKYEFLVQSYKETSAPTTKQKIDRAEYGDGKLKLFKSVNDKSFSGIVKVVNEDGDVLLSFDDVYLNMLYSSIDFYQLNGKKYIELPVSDGENGYVNVLYLLGDSGTSVQEIARTKPVKVEKYYNAAGVQVDKNAKGIVITDDRKKYINQ